MESEQSAPPNSLFFQEDGGFVPTEYSRGPWVGDALHGGPTAALLAHLCETARGDAGEIDPIEMHPARLTVELLSPVPLVRLRPVVQVVRAGRKIRLVEAELWDGDRRVAAARLAQIRTKSLTLPIDTQSRSAPMTTPEVSAPLASARSTPIGTSETICYHSHATEHRFPIGNWVDRRPAFDWIRMLVPLLPETEPSPLVRVAAAADFPNGISGPLPFEDWLYINPDLTVHLHRLPEGEWVGLDASCRVQSTGVGTSTADLFDESGHLGHSHQSLLIDDSRP